MRETTEKLGAHEVAAWLRRHPTFLQQFPAMPEPEQMWAVETPAETNRVYTGERFQAQIDRLQRTWSSCTLPAEDSQRDARNALTAA